MTPDEAHAKRRAVSEELKKAPRPPIDPRRDMVGFNAWKLLKRAQIGRRRGSRNLQKIHFSALQLLAEIDAPSELIMLFSHLLDGGGPGVFHKERPALEKDSRQREAAIFHAAKPNASVTDIARILAGETGDPAAYRKQAKKLLTDDEHLRRVAAFRSEPGK